MPDMQKYSIDSGTYKALEWQFIIDKLLKNSSTEQGFDYINNLPLLSREKIKLQLDLISAIKEILELGDSFEFKTEINIKNIIEYTIKGGICNLEEINSVKKFIQTIKNLFLFKEKYKTTYPSLNEFNELDFNKELLKLLNDSVNDNAELNENQFPELKKIKKQIYSVKNQIEKEMQHLIRAPEFKNILMDNIISIKNDRFVIPVKAKMKQSLKGTVHDISASGATLFFEPEQIANLNNRLLLLDRELGFEITRILRKLSNNISKNSEQFEKQISITAYFDFIKSAVFLSRGIKGNAPIIIEEPSFDLKDLTHPLLNYLSPEEVIKNSIKMNFVKNGLIISGVNTGGKTVLLKSIGLAALLTLYGLHIPASADSKIGLFSNIMVNIGDDQNINESLSTFSAQLINIKDILSKINNESLVLIDEIMAGTNPRQGAALAQTFIEEMIESGAKIIITTHFSELKELAAKDSRFQNASVLFNLDNLKPLYKLKTGIPGTSYAFEIAKKYGLSQKLINKSRKLLNEKERSYEELIEYVLDQEKKLTDQREKISEKERELEKTINNYKKMQIQLDKKSDDIKKKEGIHFINEISKYKEHISEQIQRLKQEIISAKEQMPAAASLQKEINSFDATVRTELYKIKKKEAADKYQALEINQVENGMQVFVATFNKSGIIEQINFKKKSCEILIGSFKTRLPISELFLIRKPDKQKIQKKSTVVNKSVPLKRKSLDQLIPLTIQLKNNTVDLRGLNTDEALNKLDNGLDVVMKSHIKTAVIIHGHGLQILKKAVRENLSYSPYIKAYRPGKREEGGDGVTIVEMNL